MRTHITTNDTTLAVTPPVTPPATQATGGGGSSPSVDTLGAPRLLELGLGYAAR